jgi:hypothetical protein
METKSLNRSSIFGGILLILLGLVFLVATLGVYNFNWGNIWPAFPMIFGLSLLAQAFTVEESRRAGFAGSGVMLVSLALFFFANTLGVFSWSDQRVLWPVYLLIGGAAFLAGYFASGFTKSGHLVVGLVALISGAILLAATLSGTLNFLLFNWLDGVFEYGWAADWWPVLPLAAGALLLAMALLAQDSSARAGLAIGGTIPFLTGIFFLATTLGYISWEDQGRLWPIYPLIVAAAFVVGYLVSGREHRVLLVPATVLGFVGVLFLSLTLTEFSLIGQLWPLALIIAGLVMLISRGDGGNQMTTTGIRH